MLSTPKIELKICQVSCLNFNVSHDCADQDQLQKKCNAIQALGSQEGGTLYFKIEPSMLRSLHSFQFF